MEKHALQNSALNREVSGLTPSASQGKEDGENSGMCLKDVGPNDSITSSPSDRGKSSTPPILKKEKSPGTTPDSAKKEKSVKFLEDPVMVDVSLKNGKEPTGKTYVQHQQALKKVPSTESKAPAKGIDIDQHIRNSWMTLESMEYITYLLCSFAQWLSGFLYVFSGIWNITVSLSH